MILRRLFQVHTSLTDFDLAFKALDSYLEIITRAKYRAEKSGESPVGLDNDETLLRTVSEGIIVLCCYGFMKEAERAKDLTDTVEEWLKKYRREPPPGSAVNGDVFADTRDELQSQVGISPTAFAAVHRAIGIGLANWARWTPVSENRREIQAKAIANLKRSLEPSFGDSNNVIAIFSLGLLLAETRDLKSAIEIVKKGLELSDQPTAVNGSTEDSSYKPQQYKRERDLIPLWHLLALLLSARQDFDTAGRSCEAAFEQFPNPNVLFGHRNPKVGENSRIEKEKAAFTLPSIHTRQQQGLVDDMEGREKERIIEIRMTQLALTEVLEGPEVAVNMSDELLSLFVRLFGHLGIDVGEKPKQAALVPPKSSAGTIKSFRGSLFGRKKAARSNLRDSAMSHEAPPVPGNGAPTSQRLSDGTADAPIIQVTDEDPTFPNEKTQTARHSDLLHHGDGRPVHKLHRREGSINKMIRQHSQERASRPASSYQSSRRQSYETGREGMSARNSLKSHQRAHTSDGSPSVPSPDEVGIAISADLPSRSSPTSGHDESPKAKQQLPPMAHNINPNQAPPPPGHSKQPPQQDVRLPAIAPFNSSTQPRPRFPKAPAQKQALSIIIKIWLLIAGLYRRASMFEDAREACDEASKQASRVEELIATQESSARAFADPGWGGGKCSDELWADLYAERGYLAQALESPHEAMDLFEQAVMYCPDHPKATVGLANLLLDIYDQTIPAERPKPSLDPGLSSISLSVSPAKPAAANQSDRNPTSLQNGSAANGTGAAPRPSSAHRKTPENLNRLAARDRAYGLLSTVTKLGTGWDNSEAWFALARAYEEGGQIDKAKEVLWWCVELEDRRPVRHWWNLGSGGYVL